jgi:hypothetical protein
MGTKVFDNALDLITFSRASGGTSLRKISYGSELVENGTFDGDTTGWSDESIGTGSISWNASGYIDLLSSDSSNRGIAMQQFSVEVGKTYLLSVNFVTSATVFAGSSQSTAPSFSDGNEYGGLINPGAGNKTLVFTATGTTLYLTLFSLISGGTFNLDNVSVKEVLFDQPDGTLTLFNHPNNIPRIDYNADGTVKGLLIEEQRTNLVAYSIPDSTNWNEVGVTILENNAVSPDGSTTASKIQEDATTSARVAGFQNTTIVSGSVYCLSFYAKSSGRTWVRLGAGNSPWGTGDYLTSRSIYFDLTTGTVGTKGSTWDSAGIEDVGGGWFRCYGIGTAASTTTVNFDIGPASVNLGGSYAGDGSSGVLIYGAQLEAGSFPTSYIPNNGATSGATRSADIASIPVTDFGYNQKAGSFVVEYTRGADSNSSRRVFEIANGSNTSTSIRVLSGGATSVNADGNIAFSVPVNTDAKIAFAVKENDLAGSLDGGTPITDSSVSMLTNAQATSLSIGVRNDLGFHWLNGHIKSLSYFPRRLSDTQLQELTS